MCKISAILAHRVASERVVALKCSAVWCAFSLKQCNHFSMVIILWCTFSPKQSSAISRLPSVRLGAARRCTYFLDYCPTIDKLSSLLYSLIFSSSTSSLIEDTSNMPKDTIEHFKAVGFRSFSGISAFISSNRSWRTVAREVAQTAK